MPRRGLAIHMSVIPFLLSNATSNYSTHVLLKVFFYNFTIKSIAFDKLRSDKVLMVNIWHLM